MVRSLYNCPGITATRPEVTSLSLASGKEAVVTYPNPSRGQFRVQLQNFLPGKAEVAVFDAKGTLIEKRSINVTPNISANFNLTNKPAGLYTIKILSKTGANVSKVLIQ